MSWRACSRARSSRAASEPPCASSSTARLSGWPQVRVLPGAFSLPPGEKHTPPRDPAPRVDRCGNSQVRYGFLRLRRVALVLHPQKLDDVLDIANTRYPAADPA